MLELPTLATYRVIYGDPDYVRDRFFIYDTAHFTPKKPVMNVVPRRTKGWLFGLRMILLLLCLPNPFFSF